MQELQNFISGSAHLSMFVALTILLVVALVANYVVKRLLVNIVHRLIALSPLVTEEDLIDNKIIPRIANIIPAAVFIFGISFVPEMPENITLLMKNIASAVIVLSVAMSICSAFDAIDALYMRRPDAENKPIKGYIQVLKIIIYFVAAILIISTLIDKSPLILFSGLGAIAAVLLLIFQDTILSLVASVQVSTNDMLQVGDWIEMPSLNVNGSVIDIALHSVRVRNLDNTITTLPTRRLVSDSFKNWRGLKDQGGRCIQRALFIDQNTIHFLTEKEKEFLKDKLFLEEFLSDISQEETFTTGKTTNINAFCVYAVKYLKKHPRIHSQLPILLRHLTSSPKGLPLEIYCFANTTDWAEYEAIQNDVFSYFYAILPEFGLKIFQEPSGHDFKEYPKSFLN